jgi:hypothetical protein
VSPEGAGHLTGAFVVPGVNLPSAGAWKCWILLDFGARISYLG